ncbi:MAG: hypothetical protein JW857_07735, partial [Bacteroidales bacterium]|nr:hypothetical protein [Bacteroidales bacterium]
MGESKRASFSLTLPNATFWLATLTIYSFLFAISINKVFAQTPNATITANYCLVPGKVRLSATGGGTYYWPYNGSTDQYIDVDLVGTYSVIVTLDGFSNSASIEVSNEMVINGDFTNGNTSFYSDYTYYADNPLVNNELVPDDGTNGYGVGTNGQNYHSNFWGIDHTNNAEGNRNFLLVNGHGSTLTIWQQTVNVVPNTNYYFSAWAMSLNTAGNYARLQFEVNGVRVGSEAVLGPGPKNAAQAEANTYWKRFYSTTLWNSGSISGPITIRIVNNVDYAAGNDFGIDDISFGTLDVIPATINPQALINQLCEGETIELMANVSGGKTPYVFSWTGPNGFTSNEENPIIENADKSNEGTYTLVFSDAYGCEMQSASTTVIVNEASVSEITESACESFTSNGETFTESGIFTQNLVGVNGCDSTLTLHLTINQPTTSEITETECESFTLNGETFTESGTYTQNLVGINGCDSTLTLHLTINQSTTSEITETACESYTINGETFTESGIYTQTLTNYLGCDSILTLNLTINQPTSAEITETACERFTINGETFTESGTYTQNLVGINGCDSTLILHLTINQPTSAEITETACESFTINGETFTESGIYNQTLTNYLGCDSILTLNLTINQPSSSELFETACESFTINGETFTESGIFTQNLVAINGCDSTLTLHLSIKQPTTSEITETACESFTSNGETFTESGIYTQNLVGINGCDSTLTLHLTINQPTVSELFETTCESITLNGETFKESGIYTQNLVAINGCDSTLTLHLTINQPTSVEITETACESYTLNGETFT